MGVEKPHLRWDTYTMWLGTQSVPSNFVFQKYLHDEAIIAGELLAAFRMHIPLFLNS